MGVGDDKRGPWIPLSVTHERERERGSGVTGTVWRWAAAWLRAPASEGAVAGRVALGRLLSQASLWFSFFYFFFCLFSIPNSKFFFLFPP